MTAKPCREDEAYDAGLLAGFEDGLNEGHARGDAQASLARLDLEIAWSLLRRVEWVQPFSNANPECPICGGRRHLGHIGGCEIAAALDGAR